MNDKQFKKMDHNHALIMILLGLIAIILIIQPIHAQTITMSNPGSANSRDIAVYYPNGSMVGLYNDTSTIITDANESYIFTLVPVSSNPLTDPSDWLVNQAIPFVQSNVIGLIVICFAIGLIVVRIL